MHLDSLAVDGVTVLAVRGAVGCDDVPGLLLAVERSRSAGPRAVVVDLGEVTTLDAGLVGRLPELGGPASSAPLSVCGLSVGTALADLPVHRDRGQALAQVGERRAAPRLRVPLPYDSRGPALARRAVADGVRARGLRAVEGDLVLLVSELVTNAVRHACPPVRLELQVDATAVVVAVVDGSVDGPQERAAGPAAEGGRGMHLLASLATQHGVRRGPDGKTVWASLALQEQPAPA